MRSWEDLRDIFFPMVPITSQFLPFFSQSLAGSLKQHHRKQTMQFNSFVIIFAWDQSMQISQRT